MVNMWDYDKKELSKTEAGQIKILERLINFGFYLKNKKKIKLSLVKKYWHKLKIDPGRKKFLQYIIWGK